MAPRTAILSVVVAVAVCLSVVRAVPLHNLRGKTAINVAKELAASSGWGPTKVKQHAGYIKVKSTVDVNLFYWMFESRRAPSTDPIVLWLTGGPGCSSELALFYENGPMKVDKDLNVTLNPYAWNTEANLIFVDQPVGTGFSYTDDPFDGVTNEKKMADDMYNFLQQFVAQFPEYAGLPFYLIGESYAGHYVPALGARIVQGNAASGHPYMDGEGRALAGSSIPLQAIGIGNGWVDPAIQYGQYAPFAYEHKLISESTYSKLNATYIECQKWIERAKKVKLEWPIAYSTCMSIVSTIQEEGGNFNVYNVDLNCTYPPLCYDFSPLNKLMEEPALRQGLGVGNRKWSSCSSFPHMLLLGDWINNLETDVPVILAAGVRVLVYSGDLDFICNYMGGRAWVSAMQWPGQTGYNAAQPGNWVVNNATAGVAHSYQNLTFLQVHQAGHMVPMDQPVNALDMLHRLLNNLPFLN